MQPSTVRSPDPISFLNGAGLPLKPRILVVDDQQVNIQALYEIFRADHEVLVATSGDQAIEICRRKSPHLVLLDVIMPEMSGHETCRRLKEHQETREIPVIFVTSQDSSDDEAYGLEVGAVDFIRKPVSPAVVRARVHTHLVLKAQADMLRSLAFVDGLTGVANRRVFDEQLDLAWRAGRRTDSDLSILMIDVDHFKLYNDRYGHQEGDRCLKDIASTLQSELGRPHDLLARYGGEEFACLLPGTDAPGAEAIAESLRRAVESRQIPHAASPASGIVTLSIGRATCTPGPNASASDLLLAADNQLYRAKKAGRNRVMGAEDREPLECGSRLDFNLGAAGPDRSRRQLPIPGVDLQLLPARTI